MAIYPTDDPHRVLHYASLSDIGRERSRNEDATGFFPHGTPADTFLMVVADGVGGNLAGDVASRLAVDTVSLEFSHLIGYQNPAIALQASLITANQAIYQAGQEDPDRNGMATTCTAAVIMNGEVVLGHVGDCRAYLAVNGNIQQLTDDHSVAAECSRRGTPLPADEQVLCNVLTRWLGNQSEVTPDIVGSVPMPMHSTLILCSDGLTKVTTPEEIHSEAVGNTPESACQRLVQVALERGGPDNITIQIARFVQP
jgi:protein phosphatase